jgi:hypothetical protein
MYTTEENLVLDTVSNHGEHSCAYSFRGGHVLYLASENTTKCAIIL